MSAASQLVVLADGAGISVSAEQQSALCFSMYSERKKIKVYFHLLLELIFIVDCLSLTAPYDRAGTEVALSSADVLLFLGVIL